jgi:hypothetical protein
LPTTVDVTLANELQSFAHVIAGQSALEDAWTGKSQPTWVQKACGLCGHEQSVRIPFVRHICLSCSSTWSPARCATCGVTTIVFRRDPSGPITAQCFCGGDLQLVAYLPRQRTIDPTKKPNLLDTIAMSPMSPPSGRLRTIARVVGCLVAFGAVVTGAWVITSVRSDAPPPAPVEQVAPAVAPGSVAAAGDAAGHRLLSRGQDNNVFACQAEYIAESQVPGSHWPAAETSSPTNRTYVDACGAVVAVR